MKKGERTLCRMSCDAEPSPQSRQADCHEEQMLITVRPVDDGEYGEEERAGNRQQRCNREPAVADGSSSGGEKGWHAHHHLAKLFSANYFNRVIFPNEDHPD